MSSSLKIEKVIVPEEVPGLEPKNEVLIIYSPAGRVTIPLFTTKYSPRCKTWGFVPYSMDFALLV